MEIKAGGNSACCDLSIIIPAFNEEFYLPTTLKHLKSALSECQVVKDYEIIVVNNDSTDDTAIVAQEMGSKVVFERERKISKVRNTGVSFSTGRFLMFIDADTIVPVSTIEQSYNSLLSGIAYGGGALIKFDKKSENFFLGKIVPSFWNWLSKTFRMAAGSFIFCYKQDFIDCGGFPESMYAGEELAFVRNLKRMKRKSKSKFLMITDFPCHHFFEKT
jgi:glycosyltransferase involved in cell wall biosynthesis